ncbi:FG-GAP repeat domain-containing protein [Primorskyibacter sp. S87]|uniref:FG-GAP repeat domain-containing protein n=1 Tax=Primorskyibacter sp. S87 TaxID=3415126 RepID=UPI003C798178
MSARFTEPTDRYAHEVLGDAIEYGGLELKVGDASSQNRTTVVKIRLPLDRVFEDLVPRLADVDGDGLPEAVVVETQIDTGAQLAIYDTTGAKLVATPHIGRSNRWLAPAGIADLDGDGHIELAYVDRPHLAKTLRIWRYADRQLREIAALPGLTNHRIGEDFITGGLRQCGERPELILVSGDWRRIVSVSFDRSAGWQVNDRGAFKGPSSVQSALEC